MANNFVAIPVVESSLYLFGGHQRTVAGGWSFFEQKHQAFELMCVIGGHQTTELKGLATYTYGPGDVMIIAPGTVHTNRNASRTATMTYITFHFNIESLELKSEITGKLANIVLEADTLLAKLATETAKQMVKDSARKDLNQEQINIKIQIGLLNLLYGLAIHNKEYQLSGAKFTEREARIGREMATIIADKIEQEDLQSFSFEEICKAVGVSTGYGHRTFKKVYGVTPLHYIEEQKYRKAKLLLGSADYSIEEIAFKMGASSMSNFTKQFKKWSGVTPSRYRRQMVDKRSVKNVKESGYFE